MGSSFNLKHNKYTSTPDWFKNSTSVTSNPVTNTTSSYGGVMFSSTHISTNVDYNEIPIDNSTIVWSDEKLSVPIDNDTITIKDGKLVASFKQIEVLGDYVTVEGALDVNGLKNFKPGILIDGVEVSKPKDDVIYIGSNLVVKGGITMYSQVGDADVSGIYEGLPIDMETLVWDTNGNLAINPDIDLGGAGTWDELDGKPTWITVTKPTWDYVNDIYNKPDLSVYAKKATTLAGYGITDAYTSAKVDELLGNYVTLATNQTITGEKNFTGGLKVNGSPIIYNATGKYWKLEGDLLITGGVTMYGNDSSFVSSTIMDAILTDGTTIRVNPTTKKLEVLGGAGGTATQITWNNVTDKPSWLQDDTISYTEISGTPTLATVATSGKYSDLSGTPDLSAYLKTANLMSNVAVDNTTIAKNTNDQLYVKKENIVKIVTSLPAASNRTTNTLYVIVG